MWEGSYGKEPFDLRLTVLRFMRCLHKILALTLVGTLLFGGGYYIKNVLLRPEKEYAATSTFKVEYEVPPTQSGDYYINEMTWNTLVQSREFLEAVQKHLTEASGNGTEMKLEITVEELAEAISAKLPSDWNIPTITVVANDPAKSIRIAAAAEAAMEQEFVEIMEEVRAVRVLDPASSAEEVKLDVRPVRAFVLSALLTFFFVSVIFLLKEIGDDSIWLPATLRHRYGLDVLGTINSAALKENIAYLFAGKEKIAVCSVDDSVAVTEVVQRFEELRLEELSAEEKVTIEEGADRRWIPVPAPALHPESCRQLREMDGILLVVPAGSHAGKPLEYVIDYLTQQDCKITAAILWEADEKLLEVYYCFSKER